MSSASSSEDEKDKKVEMKDTNYLPSPVTVQVEVVDGKDFKKEKENEPEPSFSTFINDVVEMEEEPEKERREEEEDKDPRKRKIRIIKDVFVHIIWIAMGSLMIYYFYLIISQYLGSKSQPTSTVTYSTNITLLFPAVTICNWNQVINNTYEDYENLTMLDCFNWQNNETCVPLFTYEVIPTSFGNFNCYVFNNDTNHVYNSSQTGFGGSFSALFLVTQPPSNYLFRTGLQVTFDAPGTVPDVYNEIRFAPPGYDSFYGIQVVSTTYENESNPNNQGPFFSYNTLYSATTLPFGVANKTDALVSISFAFQTLNLQDIDYASTYKITNLFGDFSGMIGVLMGIDVIKLSASIPVMILACRKRKLKYVTEHFTG